MLSVLSLYKAHWLEPGYVISNFLSQTTTCKGHEEGGQPFIAGWTHKWLGCRYTSSSRGCHTGFCRSDKFRITCFLTLSLLCGQFLYIATSFTEHNMGVGFFDESFYLQLLCSTLFLTFLLQLCGSKLVASFYRLCCHHISRSLVFRSTRNTHSGVWRRLTSTVHFYFEWISSYLINFLGECFDDIGPSTVLKDLKFASDSTSVLMVGACLFSSSEIFSDRHNIKYPF